MATVRSGFNWFTLPRAAEVKDYEDVDDDPVKPSESPLVATITNEATEDDPKDGETDEFDLYAPVETDETDSPIIEELDKPEPLDGDDSDEGPPKPPLA